jgi:hypothetical protein
MIPNRVDVVCRQSDLCSAPIPALIQESTMTKSQTKKPAPVPQTKAAAPKKPDQSKSKQGRMIALMQRTQGATVDELMKTTGWQKHTVRGAISGSLRKRLKLKVTLVETAKGSAYRIQP